MSSSRSSLLLLILLLLSQQLLATKVPKRVPRQNRSHQLLASLGVNAQRFDPRRLENDSPLYTHIDKELRQILLLTRRSTLSWALNNVEALKARNTREGKMQARIPRQVPFPCPLNNTRSMVPPTSVERLRPGDIDVIAAFGDSLSAGSGILSTNAFDMVNEFRGMSFSGGGLDNWRQYLTLPNILKVFNPQLYGFSVGNSLVVNHAKARLNIAEPMLMARDLPFQARVLIDLLRRDPRVDMKRHWKLLTIYVSNNDICTDMCHWDNPKAFLERYERDLRQTFALLRDNVPRLLINMIVVPNLMNTLGSMSQLPLQCFMVHHMACHCLVSDSLSAAHRKQRLKLLHRHQQLDFDIARLPEFQREDFAIIAHPMIMNVTAVTLPDGRTDWRYFAHDCFHFSQLGHAILANMLWNSMLLPDELKPVQIHNPFENFMCPTAEQPYFVTRPSSKS